MIALSSPTTIHSLKSLLYVTPFKSFIVPDVLVTQVYPSLDVLIVPALPTAINNELAYNTSFNVVPVG